MCNLNWTKSHGNPLPQMGCDIVLDSKSTSFSVGDVISGEIRFNVSKAFYTWAVRVALEGTAVVKLGEGPDQKKTETFLDIGENIFGRGEKIAFPAGQKNLKFSLKITPPSNGSGLPGSMKQSYGFIQYQLLVYMKQELRIFKQAEKVVTVRSWFDIKSGGSDAMKPVGHDTFGKSQASGMLRFLGNKGGSNRPGVSLRLNRSGYVKGEDIPFQVDFKNMSPSQVSQAKGTLIQRIVYSVGTSQKVVLSELARGETKSVGDGENGGGKWVEKLHIPSTESVTPTSQTGNIEVSYSVTVTVTMSSGGDPFVVEAPIKVGTTM